MPRKSTDQIGYHDFCAADRELASQLDQQSRCLLIAEFDRHVLEIGRRLVSRGLAEEWPELFGIAYPDAGQTDPMEWLASGGQFA